MSCALDGADTAEKLTEGIAESLPATVLAYDATNGVVNSSSRALGSGHESASLHTTLTVRVVETGRYVMPLLTPPGCTAVTEHSPGEKSFIVELETVQLPESNANATGRDDDAVAWSV